jgi:hypothetical protein
VYARASPLRVTRPSAPARASPIALVEITAVDAVKAEIPEAKVVKSAPVDDETAAAVKAAAAAAGDAPAS